MPSLHKTVELEIDLRLKAEMKSLWPVLLKADPPGLLTVFAANRDSEFPPMKLAHHEKSLKAPWNDSFI